MAEVASDLYQTVERTVGGMGYQLVDVERLGGGLVASEFGCGDKESVWKTASA